MNRRAKTRLFAVFFSIGFLIGTGPKEAVGSGFVAACTSSEFLPIEESVRTLIREWETVSSRTKTDEALECGFYLDGRRRLELLERLVRAEAFDTEKMVYFDLLYDLLAAKEKARAKRDFIRGVLEQIRSGELKRVDGFYEAPRPDPPPYPGFNGMRWSSEAEARESLIYADREIANHDGAIVSYELEIRNWMQLPLKSGTARKQQERVDFAMIEDYLGSGYKMLNAALRMGGDAARCAQPYRDALMRALARFPSYSGLVWRGIRSHPSEPLAGYEAGSLIQANAFTSTSRDSVEAQGFGPEHFVQIQSRSCRDLGRRNKQEKEVLCLPGTRFKVLQVTGPDISAGRHGYRYVLSEVDSPVADSVLAAPKKKF